MIRRLVLSLALALALPGSAAAATFTGQWNNTTFGSFGDVLFDVMVAPPNVTVTADFDGGVFGFGDPPPMVVPGMIDVLGNATVMSAGDPFFGDVAGTLSVAGVVDIDITNLPLGGPTPTGFNIFSTSLDGTFDGTTFDLNYVVIFNCGFPGSTACPGPGPGTEGLHYALGTVNATLVPLPGAAALLLGGALGLAGWGRRRRH